MLGRHIREPLCYIHVCKGEVANFGLQFLGEILSLLQLMLSLSDWTDADHLLLELVAQGLLVVKLAEHNIELAIDPLVVVLHEVPQQVVFFEYLL